MIALLIVVCCIAASHHTPVKKFLLTGRAQGTTYQIIYYAEDSIVSTKQVDSILDKLDSSLSLYKPYSLINQFNQSDSGGAVDEHFLKVVKKSMSTFQETFGVFDISVQPLVQAWGFGVSKIEKLPNAEVIRSIKDCIGSDFLEISGYKIVKKKSCIKIDLNGIAQGYSVDVLAGFLDSQGLTDYLVELGGEIKVRGRRQPGNEKMKIGIETPGNDEYERGLFQKIVCIEEGALTTSGNYRRYYESGGKKISHLIDPQTGYPVNNELISITVFAKDAITADAFDNALMVMGLKKAMTFVDERSEIAAHFIYRTKSGLVKDTMSKAFSSLVQQ
jgi:thiamine biosynthesis lipoprotein